MFLMIFWTVGIVAHPHSVTKKASDRIDIDLLTILAGAFTRSIESKKLQVQLHGKDLAYQKAKGIFDPQIKGKTTLLSNNADGGESMFAVEDSSRQQVQASYNRLFKTGTTLVVGWQLDHQKTSYSTTQIPEVDSYTNKLTVSLRQSLWRNAFGKNLTLQLQQAKLQGTIVEHRVKSAMEQMVIGLVDLYYKAWLLQAQLRAAEQNLVLQQRLKRVVTIKHNLGTAETADLLQVNSSLVSARQQVADKERALRSIWYQLAISVNLTAEQTHIDIKRLAIAIDYQSQEAVQSCQTLRVRDYRQLTSQQLQMFLVVADSWQHQLAQRRQTLLPDVYLELSASNNGVDDNFWNSIGDSLTEDNFTVSLAVGIDMTLGKTTQIVNLKETAQKKYLNDLQLQQTKDNLRLAALTACDNLEALVAKEKNLQIILNRQRKRIALQEERFRLGQIDVVTVVQASNDVINSEFQLRETMQRIAVGVWKVRAVNDQVLNYLQTRVTQQTGVVE